MTQPDLPIEKLKALIPRLASTHDGEVVATARAIERILQRFGCDWHDLCSVIGPAPIIVEQKVEFEDINKTKFTDAPWRSTAAYCARYDFKMTSKESQFVNDLLHHWKGNLTEKQAKWLASIATRLGA